MFFKILFFIYQWLIAIPIILVLTILTSLSTIILSPILPNNRISYFPAKWWSRLCCWLLFVRVKCTIPESVKPTQSYVFVINHQSIFDIFAVYGWLPNIFKWIMKAEVRDIPLVGKACDSAGHIFIDRSNNLSAKRSLTRAAKQLTDGNSIVVFPEGTRTRNGKMGRFKRGAFMVAEEVNLPLVPVTISGSYERLKKGAFLVSSGLITMTIHSPIASTQSDKSLNDIILEAWNIVNDGLGETTDEI